MHHYLLHMAVSFGCNAILSRAGNLPLCWHISCLIIGRDTYLIAKIQCSKDLIVSSKHCSWGNKSYTVFEDILRKLFLFSMDKVGPWGFGGLKTLHPSFYNYFGLCCWSLLFSRRNGKKWNGSSTWSSFCYVAYLCNLDVDWNPVLDERTELGTFLQQTAPGSKT